MPSPAVVSLTDRLPPFVVVNTNQTDADLMGELIRLEERREREPWERRQVADPPRWRNPHELDQMNDEELAALPQGDYE